jgi:uncharacterized protein
MRAAPALSRSITDAQDLLVQAMLDPEFYPKPPTKVTHLETHISHLFFVGDLVYKIKKAAHYSFLDYSTLAKRRHFLQEELRLNRRLAPSVYLGVLPICQDETGWRLGGWLEPAEYTLVMRRLSEKRMLPFLLATGQVTKAMIEALADLIARFHEQADRGARIGAERYLQVVEQQWNENITDLAPFIRGSREGEIYAAIQTFGKEFLARHGELLMRRARDGWIRDVHGDLHCEHINFAPEGIQIFDCIDFSPRLRRCDLASEIAFLLMDLQARGGAVWIQPFLKRYQAAIPDPDLPVLLPFGKSYRALVRAKVHALRLGRWNDESASYFRLAGQLTWDARKPFLVLVCGLTGSGKSTLSRELGERTGLPVINSDVVRKSITGKSGRQDVELNQGIYTPLMNEMTYTDMLRQAEKQIERGNGAIVDATFVRRAQRDKFARLAEKHHIPLALIHCSASDSATEKRLARRAAKGQDVSDGSWQIYVEQKSVAEAPEEFLPSSVLTLNTEAPIDRLAQTAEQFLRSRLP